MGRYRLLAGSPQRTARAAAALLRSSARVPDSNLNAETLGWRGLQGVLWWPSARQHER